MSVAPLSTGFSNLMEVLRYRASREADREVFTFLGDGETHEESLTYAQLDVRARAMGAELQRLGHEGDRVLLLCPPGPNYIASLFGCIFGGMLAVPASLPPWGRSASVARGMALSSGARLGLTTRDELIHAQRELPHLRWLTVDALPEGSENRWREPRLTSETVAYLVYTSGSTASPKGVMVTHGNLLHSILSEAAQLDPSRSHRVVNWGIPEAAGTLSWSIMQPVIAGMAATHIAAEAFAARPALWIETMSRTRATWCTFPNFAYDLAIESIAPGELGNLDLSNWQYAWNGGDQVRADTIERFETALSVAGLKPGTVHTAYGMSEAAGISWNWDRPRVLTLDRAKLQEGLAVPIGEGDGRVLVSQGKALPGQALTIVDPSTRAQLPEGRVGEIWTAGPHVAAGYWNWPEETQSAFQNRLSTGEGPFLRTGDLGFLHEGELYIAGRLKEVIILRGRNLYPQDLELAAERAHPTLQPRSGAAFALDDGTTEQLVMVQEVEPRQSNLPQVARALRQTLEEQLAAQPDFVVLIPSTTLPRTPTGKVSRAACREALKSGTLRILHKSARASGWDGDTSALDPSSTITTRLSRIWADVLGVESVAPDDNFFALGGDSLAATRVIGRIRKEFLIDLPLIALFDAPTGVELARIVERSHSVTEGMQRPQLVARSRPESR